MPLCLLTRSEEMVVRESKFLVWNVIFIQACILFNSWNGVIFVYQFCCLNRSFLIYVWIFNFFSLCER